MLNKWFLVVLTLNKSGGTAQTITAFDTYDDAEDEWRDQMSTVGGNPQTAYAVFEILDPYGRPVGTNIYTVNKLPKPEPEPEPEVEG